MQKVISFAISVTTLWPIYTCTLLVALANSEDSASLYRLYKQSMYVNIDILATSHINCIVARFLINVGYQVMMTLHFLNDVANTKIENYVKIASSKSETMGKLINRIPGSRLLISSLPGSALRTLVDIARQASRCQQVLSKPCLVNLISKDTHLVFSIYLQALRCQQVLSKPCLVNLISKDAHLVFSIY